MRKNNLLKLIIILIIFIIIICIFLRYINIKNGEKINNNVNNEIKDSYSTILKEKYECNEFRITTISTEDLLKMYLNDYKYNMLNNVEIAYNTLNKEYREEKFGNIEEYKKYINNNIEEIQKIKLNQYAINYYEGYEIYTCTDEYDNYYIFEVSAVMKYTVKLDTYRVLDNEELEKYKELTTVERAGYNIKRVVDAINNKDYNFVYGKLDKTFKENSYQTIESFEEDIKKNLFENNEVEDTLKSTREGDLYVYKFSVQDSKNEKNKKDITIIMQLKEGTDFVMSFSWE